jgi:transcriptional regulator with XRE-family HTH domain
VLIPNLKQWRELRGLTQQELCEKAGVSLRAVAGYEAGAGAWPNTVRKLAEALDVSVMDLAGVDALPKAEAPSPQPSLDEALHEARRNDWFAAYDRLGRRLFDRWESELEEKALYAGENPGAFIAWFEGIVRTQNAYTAEVLRLDLADGEPWPALANELDPDLRERDRRFWRRVREVLQQVRPSVGAEEYARLLEEIGELPERSLAG